MRARSCWFTNRLSVRPRGIKSKLDVLENMFGKAVRARARSFKSISRTKLLYICVFICSVCLLSSCHLATRYAELFGLLGAESNKDAAARLYSFLYYYIYIYSYRTTHIGIAVGHMDGGGGRHPHQHPHTPKRIAPPKCIVVFGIFAIARQMRLLSLVST